MTRSARALLVKPTSLRLHGAWVEAPQSSADCKACLRSVRAKNRLAYWVVTEEGELAGVIHVGAIVHGIFCSGFLAYDSFVPHDGQG